MEKDKKIVKELFELIKKSPSSFHAAFNLGALLEKAGFEELSESEKWKIESGKKYFVKRNDSSIISFVLPPKAEKFLIVASHGDSPSFKIKDNPEICSEGCYLSINTEKYGGMLMPQWFDRPLSVAGRVMVSNEKGIESRLLNIDRDLMMIPSLAIHMNRNANDGMKLNPQKDMIPLLAQYGDEKKRSSFKALLANELKVNAEDILAYDMFLYNRMEGTIWGADKEFISAPQLDNLMCAFASTKAILDVESKDAVLMNCVFDNEETGSQSKQGAASTFLTDVIGRIWKAVGGDNEDLLVALSKSMMVSADNAHGVHPNYPEKADPTNRPFLNGGVVIKQNAAQRYTTDALSEAVFGRICKDAGVPVQTYFNRSDVPGGSTLGNIVTSSLSIDMVDIGLAQLAMHSPYETAGVKDSLYLEKALKAFYNSSFEKKDGTIIF